MDRFILAVAGHPTYSDTRWSALGRWWGGIGLLLIAVTWKLWLPQDVYPQVPLIRLGLVFPNWLQWAGLLGLIVPLFALVAEGASGSRRQRMFAGLFLAGFAILVLADQHRLQPWAYHLALIAVLLVWSQPPVCFAYLRLLLVTIFVYSAAGKFDFTFLNSIGPEMAGEVLSWIGRDEWPAGRTVVAFVFPIVELAVAIGILVPVTSRMATKIAILTHLLLLMVLGPWGLGQRAGVLVWNLLFIGMWIILFPGSFRRRDDTTEPRLATDTHRSSLVVSICFLGAWLCPLLEPIGGYDHWLSWGLYSPRNSRVTLHVHQTVVPPDDNTGALQYLAAADEKGWRRVEVDRWSLDALRVPIYPQDRYQWGVVCAVVEELGVERFRIDVYGMARRKDGHRTARHATARSQLDDPQWRWRLNSRAR